MNRKYYEEDGLILPPSYITAYLPLAPLGALGDEPRHFPGPD
jgi:hypothetical protein